MRVISPLLSKAVQSANKRSSIEKKIKVLTDHPTFQEIKDAFFKATRYYAIGGGLFGAPAGYFKAIGQIKTKEQPAPKTMLVLYGIPGVLVGVGTGAVLGSTIPVFLSLGPTTLFIHNHLEKNKNFTQDQ